MLVIDDLHKAFGRIRAVRGVSFALKPGQVAGLLGPNGAGKTTTIRMIAGVYAPDRGRAIVNGHDTLDQPVLARRSLGYLPESAPLYPEMKVEEYLGYRARLFGMVREVRRKYIGRSIERCWLREVANRRIGVLSKGYKQRVGLAAALLHDPPVLILDEPTNGLDPTQIQETRKLIREIAANRTTLISSHILPEIERLCDRVLIVSQGQLKADGAPHELTAQVQASAVYVAQVKREKPADDDRHERLFASVPFVSQIKLDETDRAGLASGWATYRVLARLDAPDLREPIAVALSQAGVLCRELRRETISLEQVFLALTEPVKDPEPGGAAAAEEKERAA